MAKKRKFIKKYKFVASEHSRFGFVSCLLATISFVMFIVLTIVSFANRGDAGVRIGSVGFLSLIFAVAGIVFGIVSFKEKDKNYKFSKVGLVINAVLLLGWVGIIIGGIL